ncbi:MAG: DUF433 domain-containing protein [Acidobacteria bacterium]|nr:DUF433 domain-containing protein [Acidobacteriota bacterium]
MANEYIELRDGTYYVTGTRVSIDSLVYAFRRGDSAETICQNSDVLRLEEVYGAIAYYLGHQAAIDEYLLLRDEQWKAAKRDSPPLPAGLRERLMRARAEAGSQRMS